MALVTGGARGIGFETARQLHLRGASVAVLDLDAEEAREAAERIGPRAIGIGADVTDEGAVIAAVAEVVERFGGLDVAVANAGIAPPTVTTARTMPPEQWRRVIDVNLLGAWHTARAALPQVVRAAAASWSSSARSTAIANGLLASPYAVSKAGVEALGRALRAELAPLGASASVVYFGWVDTDLVRDSLDRQRRRLRRPRPARHPARLPAAADHARRRPGRRSCGRWKSGRRGPSRPSVWRYISACRGLLNPLLDRRIERDAGVAAIVAEAEAAASERVEPERPPPLALPPMPAPTYDLNGKVALVTGAARGIGFETARQMHLRGASVAVLDLDAAEAREAAERIGAAGDRDRRRRHRPGRDAGGGRRDGREASAGSTSRSPTPASPRSSSPPCAGSPARNGSGSSRSTCSASGAPCARRCRRSSSARARWSSSPPSTPSPTAWATRPTPSPRPGSSRSAGRCGSSSPPHGASATVAYFGWVDTKLVQDAFDQEDSDRIRELSPDFLLKRITPDEAGAGLVRGIEERAPRVFVPKWWRYVSALRGLVNPLLDRRMESDAKTAGADPRPRREEPSTQARASCSARAAFRTRRAAPCRRESPARYRLRWARRSSGPRSKSLRKNSRSFSGSKTPPKSRR